MAPWKYRLIAGAKLIGLLVFVSVFFPLLVHPTWSLVVLWSFALITTLVGVVEFWRHGYPALKDTLNAPLMRLLLLGLSWLAGLLAYIPTASFNSLSNVLVLKGVVTARSWLTEGTLQWSWDPCPLPPQVIELSVVKMRSANSFLLQKLFP